MNIKNGQIRHNTQFSPVYLWCAPQMEGSVGSLNPHIFSAPTLRKVFFSCTWFDAQNVYPLFYLGSTSVLIYDNFYCLLICYLPLTYPDLKYSYNCGLTDLGCQVIVISSA
jgi:hypothetical protein